MATKYSLIVWGGYTGSASWGRTSNQLTKTNHGLTKAATVVYFSGGTLPTSSPQVDTSTPYYVKVISTSAIELYTDPGLTSQVTFSATGSGWVLKSQAVVDPATFFAFCGLSDLSRWYDSGRSTYLIFDGLLSWRTDRNSNASKFDVEICEIGQVFDEHGPASEVGLGVPSARVQISTKVNDTWAAFHYGNHADGFRYVCHYSYSQNLGLTAVNSLIEGFSVVDSRNGYYNTRLLTIAGANNVARYMIVGNISGTIQNDMRALYMTGTVNRAEACLVFGCRSGVTLDNYGSMYYMHNCVATKNKTGFDCGNNGSNNGFSTTAYNCVAIGNTVEDWYSYLMNNLAAASNNAGETGEAWMTTGGTRIEITEASPYSATFVDWTNNDFRPASGSQLIDAGVEYYGILPYDIAGNEVPNYNNGGSEAVDIGAYEYDHGYGPHPASTTVTFSGVPAGSEIRVYDSGGVELAGIESSAANQVLTWTVASGAQRIVIINLAYKIKEFAYTNQAGAQTVPVQMDADQWYENP